MANDAYPIAPKNINQKHTNPNNSSFRLMI